MSVVHKTSHAPDTSFQDWETIPWSEVRKKVKRLQMRIAKATRERKHRKAASLSWILTHSYYAKLLAVKRVTTNKGRNTAGVDGVVWKTPAQKMAAIHSLKRHGYKPLPLRRQYIPKKNGKKRPLGIPTMRDRAMQALYAMALKPIAETLADPNSYGFRDGRSCQDAIQQCFNCLAKLSQAEWILEGDIKSCFDEMSHQWMLENIPMDKKILKTWLQAGYMEEGKLFPTRKGTPQGGIISPILANMTLDGLERAVRDAMPSRSKTNVIRFADDFVDTGKTKEILESKAIPAIKHFLDPRGLKLSDEKTLITNIKDGFDFLGFNVRKYNGKLLIKPSKKAVRSFLEKVRETIKSMRGAKPEELIDELNPIIRGWVNYHRHAVAKKTFSYVDWRINRLLNQWARRRHRGKTNGWIQRKYFPKHEYIGTTFAVKVKTGEGIYKLFSLQKASWTPILRHIKVKQEANPFDPEYADYFRLRRRRNWVMAREVMMLGRKTAYNLRNPALGVELLGVSRKGDAVEGLEPDDGKLSRPVLRGV